LEVTSGDASDILLQTVAFFCNAIAFAVSCSLQRIFCSARSGKTHLLMTKLADERRRLLDTQKVPRGMSYLWSRAQLFCRIC
jgi:hypothetical protein